MTTPTLTTLALSLAALQWSKLITSVFFVFCFGAVCGSFINVIVYRLPLGLSVVAPPSACTSCKTRLSWRDNIPVLGWIVLRGRCRYCKARISPEYPIVELFVALLFAVTYTLWFADARTLGAVGLDPSFWRPEWALDGIQRTWPIAILFAALLFSLVAVTIIDARTFHIPLVIPWILAGLALVVHPVGAWWIGAHGGLRRSPHPWVIPIADWPWMGAAMGAATGLLISVTLLRFRLIPRSFADYDDWQRANSPAAIPPAPAPHDEGNALLRALFFAGPIVAGMFAGLSLGMRSGNTSAFVAVGAGAGMLLGLLLRRLVPEGEPGESEPAWVHYPHARREMGKEILFLAFPAALAVVGYFAAVNAAPAPPPLWLSAFGGSLLGLVVGGGAIWFIRIAGSLAFGKEAMGLGDVHLMAAVGAALGWIDPTLAFFLAPFFGIAWVIGAMLVASLKRNGDRTGAALPYGPHLAAATMVIILAKPAVEAALTLITQRTTNLP
jgi:leader peptidase (prepilin peptidase)/N-methyltransferase